MLDRLKSILTELCEGYGRIVEMHGEVDHMHRLVQRNPRAAPSVIANNWNTVTSRLLRRDFGQELERFSSNPVLWSRSCFVACCGGAPLSVIKQYIEQQAGPDQGLMQPNGAASPPAKSGGFVYMSLRDGPTMAAALLRVLVDISEFPALRREAVPVNCE